MRGVKTSHELIIIGKGLVALFCEWGRNSNSHLSSSRATKREREKERKKERDVWNKVIKIQSRAEE